jgi:cupin 2 domain-containing protein
MKKANLFENIPTQLKEELFEELLSAKSVTIERIISKGHSSPKSGWYNQQKSEWVLLIQGEAIIAFEHEEVHLNAGDYLNIPAYTKHKVLWTLPEQETIWLAIFY